MSKEIRDLIAQPVEQLLFDLNLLQVQVVEGSHNDMIRQVIVALYENKRVIVTYTTNRKIGRMNEYAIADQSSANQNCKSQTEVDFINSAAVMQANYNNLREQNHRQAKQLREMAAILKRVVEGDNCQLSAAELLKQYEDEVGF